jgi:hypothetical protein
MEHGRLLGDQDLTTDRLDLRGGSNREEQEQREQQREPLSRPQLAPSAKV